MIHEETPLRFRVSLPYPIDSMNPFGDYERLEMVTERATHVDVNAPIKQAWRLVGEKRGSLSYDLCDDELLGALKSVFFDLAKTP